MKQIKCNKCGEPKDKECFSKGKKVCKGCMVEVQRKSVEKRKNTFDYEHLFVGNYRG